MALSTVAADVRPNDTLSKLPPSRPERFKPSDFIAAGIVFFVTLGVYIATLAPNVTLEDSGELITAAAKFGVGHPPGYPLWTMSGFLLSHLFPFGNLAWRINLLCALFGGASNAVLTLLACHSGRWLLQRWTEPEHQAAVRPYVFYMRMLVGPHHRLQRRDVEPGGHLRRPRHAQRALRQPDAALLLSVDDRAEKNAPARPRRLHFFARADQSPHAGPDHPRLLARRRPGANHARLPGQAEPSALGIFFSVFFAVNLFSLSILVYISWLSGDNRMQTISQAMAWLILAHRGRFLFLSQGIPAAPVPARRGHGRRRFLPMAITCSIRAKLDTLRYTASTAPHFWLVGSFVHPGWLQGLVANARAGMPPLPRHSIRATAGECWAWPLSRSGSSIPRS